MLDMYVSVTINELVIDFYHGFWRMSIECLMNVC